MAVTISDIVMMGGYDGSVTKLNFVESYCPCVCVEIITFNLLIFIIF